ncbi:hypothetical protein MRB53_004269 [Persea americana]|uniref:Uncharacterized protein n=1 Tax=Persea americana TaxID=3435 RepID=A0ACC2M9R2_PERAE|nr:hypothetical protein MRB53_004269 [Persea americana]
MLRRRIRIAGPSSSVQPQVKAVETQSRPAPIETGGSASSSSSCSGKKRTRGPTQDIKLLNRHSDDKLVVDFNTDGQPIGKNARDFSTLCGIVVRTPGIAPLQVKKWAEIPEQAKEKLLKTIQEFVVIDKERKKWVLQNLAKKYKDYRKDLKDKYYSTLNTDEERLQHPPPDILGEDWAWLVQYWGRAEVNV